MSKDNQQTTPNNGQTSHSEQDEATFEQLIKDLGDHLTFEDLFSQVYDQLKQAARHLMRNERPNHTWGTSGVLNEAIIKFLKRPKTWQSKDAFCAAMFVTMKHLLIDYAKKKRAAKNHAFFETLQLDQHINLKSSSQENVTQLTSALDELKSIDEQSYRDFLLHDYMGFTFDEIREFVGYSQKKIRENCLFARSFVKSKTNKK